MPDFLGGGLQAAGLDGSVFHTFGGASNPMDFGITKLGMGLFHSFGGMLGGRGAGGPNIAAVDARIKSPLPGITPASGHGPSGEGAMPHLVPNAGGGGGSAAASMGPGPGGAVNAGISAAINLGGAAFSDFFNPGPVIPFPNRDLGGGTGAMPWSAGGPQDPGGKGAALPSLGTMPGMGASAPGVPAPSGQGESVTHNHYYGDTDNSFQVHQTGVDGTGVQPWQAAANSSNRYAALSANLSG